MSKLLLYAAGTFVLMLAILLSPELHEAEAPKRTEAQQVPDQEEPFVALPMVNVRWPSEKEVPAPKTVQPKPLKSKTSSANAMPETAGNGQLGGSKGGGYNIVGHFQCSVPAYLHYMRQQNALVVVYEGRGKHFWEITAAGTVLPLGGLPGRYSPQARRLSDVFPERARVFSDVTTRYGPGNYEILLVIPEELDNRIKASLERVIQPHVPIADLSAVHLTYRQIGSSFQATVDWALANGKKITIGQTIGL